MLSSTTPRPTMHRIVAGRYHSNVARVRSLPRWAPALALASVVVAGAALRAERAIHHGAFLSTDERAYAALGRAVSHGYYDVRGMNDPLHWPPGTPLLFAVARKVAGTTDATLAPAAAYWA